MIERPPTKFVRSSGASIAYQVLGDAPIDLIVVGGPASHLDMELPLLLPGIRLKTSPTDLRPIKQMRLVRFDGQRYVLFSDVLASE